MSETLSLPKLVARPALAKIMPEVFSHFGANPSDDHLFCEILHREEMTASQFSSLSTSYKDAISKDHSLRSKLFVSDSHIIHLHAKQKLRYLERTGVPPEFWDCVPFVSEEELKRIAKPDSAADDLLIIQCGAIIASPRRTRAALRMKRRRQAKSLYELLDPLPFTLRRNHLPQNLREVCKAVPNGFTFEPQANGYCLKTIHGNIIAISEYLRHYLFFSDLFFRGWYDGRLPKQDSLQSILIAGRIMLELESWDFDADPRCTLQRRLEDDVNRRVQDQIEFIIGHEFAHHYLGHLNNGQLTEMGGLADRRVKASLVSYEHKIEHDADVSAIAEGPYTRSKRKRLLESAIYFFIGLDICESILDFFHPRPAYQIPSHPAPLERARYLISAICPMIQERSEHYDLPLAQVAKIRRWLCQEYLPVHADAIGRYGSIYLPSSKPKRAYIDRVDY